MPPYYLPELHGVINRQGGERGREKKRERKKKMGLNERNLLPQGMFCLVIFFFSCSKIQGTKTTTTTMKVAAAAPTATQTQTGTLCLLLCFKAGG